MIPIINSPSIQEVPFGSWCEMRESAIYFKQRIFTIFVYVNIATLHSLVTLKEDFYTKICFLSFFHKKFIFFHMSVFGLFSFIFFQFTIGLHVTEVSEAAGLSWVCTEMD